MWPRIRSVGDTRTDTGVGPSFDDLPVLKGNLRLSSYLHPILDATDGAVLPVNAPGLGIGPIPCRVRLHHGTSLTAWSGIVDMAAAAPAPTIRVGEGAYATLPRDPVPRWAIALIVIGGLILAALVAVIVT